MNNIDTTHSYILQIYFQFFQSKRSKIDILLQCLDMYISSLNLTWLKLFQYVNIKNNNMRRKSKRAWKCGNLNLEKFISLRDNLPIMYMYFLYTEQYLTSWGSHILFYWNIKVLFSCLQEYLKWNNRGLKKVCDRLRTTAFKLFRNFIIPFQDCTFIYSANIQRRSDIVQNKVFSKATGAMINICLRSANIDNWTSSIRPSTLYFNKIYFKAPSTVCKAFTSFSILMHWGT